MLLSMKTIIGSSVQLLARYRSEEGGTTILVNDGEDDVEKEHYRIYSNLSLTLTSLTSGGEFDKSGLLV